MAARVRGPGGREWVVRRRHAIGLPGETLWERTRRRLKPSLERARAAGEVADAGSVLDIVAEVPVIGVIAIAVGIVALLAVAGLLMVFVVVPVLVAMSS